MRLAFAIGLSLFLGTSLQQAGLETTSATNGGFLTACYVVLTPFVVWALSGARPRALVLAAGLVSLLGAWLLATGGGPALPPTIGDGLVLLADFAWATGIALTPLFLIRRGRPLTLAFVQYAVCGGLAALASMAFETVEPHAFVEAAPAILFCGLVSGALAYTLQIFAQAHTPPSEAALILSLESVFAALAGAVLLGERLSPIGSFGCAADPRRRRRGRGGAGAREQRRRPRLNGGCGISTLGRRVGLLPLSSSLQIARQDWPWSAEGGAPLDFLIALAALCFLMFVAYRGFSVILFAPIAALAAVFLTDPHAVPAAFTSLFMDKMVGFARLYFPVFLLGAVFGKVIELSGFAKAIVATIIRVVGKEQAIMAIVLVCAVLTYGGVSLFVVVFAAYPFAAELFRAGNIPKRLIPGTIALGAFSFTMDSLPFTPQIQNIIPTTYFKTTTGAAPVLGIVGAVFIFVTGIAYLEWRKRTARAAGEGYGEGHINEPPPIDVTHLASPWIAFLPLIVVFVLNIVLGGFPGVFTGLIDWAYGPNYDLKLAMDHAIPTPIPPIRAIWAVMGALLAGIVTVFLFAFRQLASTFAEGSKAAIAGALLAAMNTASEYGFGAVIAALPGFLAIRDALGAIPNPLVREAVTVTSLAGITGSASGGMSIALAAMSKEFIDMANAAHIPLEVFHRIASMASGGMDTLPHNGAVITLLAVTGLTHRESYRDIFAVTVLKTAAVFVAIGVYAAHRSLLRRAPTARRELKEGAQRTKAARADAASVGSSALFAPGRFRLPWTSCNPPTSLPMSNPLRPSAQLSVRARFSSAARLSRSRASSSPRSPTLRPAPPSVA